MRDNITCLPVDTPTLQKLRRRQAKARQGRFVKGPVTWANLCLAANAHPRAVEVYLAIKMLADTAKANRIRLPSGILQDIGVNRETKRRALAALESCDLIRIEQSKGRLPEVILTEISDRPAKPDLHANV